MSRTDRLPIEAILDAAGLPAAESIGTSRAGLPIDGYRIGSGDLKVSLIAGCHADEPVGPLTLERLAAYLTILTDDHPLTAGIRWSIVPDANPDGARANRTWSSLTDPAVDHRGEADRGYRLSSYLRHVVREMPGDDIEFGFPRDESDTQARPENLALAAFLAEDGPYHVHGSLHGMGIAPGPWFLLERAWIERTLPMRREIRRIVRSMRYSLYDPDRKGEKGFDRIDCGFTTRPDSRAMKEHFEQCGEDDVAARFRPSSMEHVRGLGGDPLTFVSEMPLFLAPPRMDSRALDFRDLLALRRRLVDASARSADLDSISRFEGISPMPIRDQQRLQLAFLEAALRAVLDS